MKKTYRLPFEKESSEIELLGVPFKMEMKTKREEEPVEVTIPDLYLMFLGGLDVGDISSLKVSEEGGQDLLTDMLLELDKAHGAKAVFAFLRMAIANYASESVGEDKSQERLEEIAQAIQTPVFLQ